MDVRESKQNVIKTVYMDRQLFIWLQTLIFCSVYSQFSWSITAWSAWLIAHNLSHMFSIPLLMINSEQTLSATPCLCLEKQIQSSSHFNSFYGFYFLCLWWKCFPQQSNLIKTLPLTILKQTEGFLFCLGTTEK